MNFILKLVPRNYRSKCQMNKQAQSIGVKVERGQKITQSKLFLDSYWFYRINVDEGFHSRKSC